MMLSKQRLLSRQLVPVRSFAALAPFVYSYITGLEPVRLGLGSVGCEAHVRATSDNDKQDDLGEEPRPAAALLLDALALAGTLATLVLTTS